MTFGSPRMLGDQLKTIVDNTPGAAGAILMGFDGIAVMQHVADGAQGEVDLESTAMEFSFRFMELRRAAQSLDMGDVQDITVKGDRQTLVCRVLSDEYFVAVLLTESAFLGKGRFLLRASAPGLLADL
ncbi:MAG: roadblock/LC7 domain-containing protein [Deltaproteobacteria bacterium]|nr:roadblock/LC7 domain-containing protein [Deltaproteobacteria bacterium]MBK8239051.1 roadblock/LC7 domain-containing protein [Deltaproteobacteria bacterium]MBK8717561.1 roadblock/LC7 domain-containing protein [Deltaproteobacteria bacterium]MBP7285831.1 roadblock/LC7 domain-containing protein [Nannocystaceae bacterium]